MMLVMRIRRSLLRSVIGERIFPIRPRKKGLLAILSFALGCTGFGGVVLGAIELIDNGSFEADPETGVDRTGWNYGAGVSNDIGFAAHDYPFLFQGQEEGTSFPGGFEFPPGAVNPSFTGTIRPLGAGAFYGSNWGTWNGTGSAGSATQIVDVSGHNGITYVFSTWLASRLGDSDYATVSLDFFGSAGGTGSPLDSLVFNGNDRLSAFIVGSLSLEGKAEPNITATQDNWTFYRATNSIPLGAQSAVIVIRGASAAPTGGNDAFVDLVSLQVVSEPSSAILLVVLVPLLFVWRLGHFGSAGNNREPAQHRNGKRERRPSLQLPGAIRPPSARSGAARCKVSPPVKAVRQGAGHACCFSMSPIF